MRCLQVVVSDTHVEGALTFDCAADQVPRFIVLLQAVMQPAAHSSAVLLVPMCRTLCRTLMLLGWARIRRSGCQAVTQPPPRGCSRAKKRSLLALLHQAPLGWEGQEEGQEEGQAEQLERRRQRKGQGRGIGQQSWGRVWLRWHLNLAPPC